MKHIKLTILFDNDLAMKSVIIDSNDTGIPESSDLLVKIAVCMLTSIKANKEDIAIQDLLRGTGIIRKK